MAMDITWQGSELYLGPRDSRSVPLLNLADPEQRSIVEHWAAQADSVPEFLEMLHLEGMIDLPVLSRLLAECSPLWRIWNRLRVFCQLAGEIGEYPSHRVIVGHAQDSIPDTAIRLSHARVSEAAEAWARFEAGDHAALGSPGLGIILSVLGFLAGQRLRLRLPQAFVFGDWVSTLLTDRAVIHGNEREVLRLEQIASQVVYGSTDQLERACVNPEVWERYRPGIAAVVRALRAGM